MRNGMMLLAACLMVSACGDREPAGGKTVAVSIQTPPVALAPVAPAATLTTDGWIGRWVGVEGLSLEIAVNEHPGTYKLHITGMDGAGDYVGASAGDAIRFVRSGRTETLRQTNGAGTGLKWLAGKTMCLTIRPGEGFCRD